ncbi:MAG: 2-isopropylmalate synthase [Nitrososphaerota archaeon]|nr:2-isopropylmalate synthase [Candidatus Calditenuis fumarioli]
MVWREFVLGRNPSLPERVQVFDTTLRDGEQSPGVALRVEEKLRIAEALADLGVAVIEAGYPAVSRGEMEAVRSIARLGLPSKICALSRCEKGDIDRAVDAGVDWVHVFIATSELHMKYKLRMTPDEVYSRAVEMVEYAKSRGVTVHFSCEDATRSERKFLLKVYRGAAEAGADSVDIPDTVGVAIPEVMKELVREVKGVTGLPVAVHCHDDMGLATANTLAGVEGGAEIVHVTVNGIGERAGNTSLEEVVLALETLYGVKTGIRLEKLASVSRLVSRLTGMVVQKNKAVVGDNAFSHESGIHVHGVINNPATYEPVMPEVVGKRRRIVLGKHSGTHAVLEVLKQHGFNLSHEETRRVLERVKELGDMGMRVTEELLLRDVIGVLDGSKPSISVESISYAKDGETFACSLVLNVRGERMESRGIGRSTVSASIDAMRRAVSALVGDVRLEDLALYVPPDPDRYPAEAEVVVVVNSKTLTGRGLAHDPGLAVAMAVAGAVSQALSVEARG